MTGQITLVETFTIKQNFLFLLLELITGEKFLEEIINNSPFEISGYNTT